MYKRQRVIRVTVTFPQESKQPQATQAPGDQSQAGQPEQDRTLELAGPLSDPIRVDAADIFPPDVPSGLAAIATENNSEISICLLYTSEAMWTMLASTPAA